MTTPCPRCSCTPQCTHPCGNADYCNGCVHCSYDSEPACTSFVRVSPDAIATQVLATIEARGDRHSRSGAREQ